MGFANGLKRLAKGTLTSLGYELRKIESHPPPVLFDDCLEALLFKQAGKSAAFVCPIASCTHSTCLGFSSRDWHPFVATLKEYAQDPSIDYNRSILSTYYKLWRPDNAALALTGFHSAPPLFHQLEPHYVFLAPWTAVSLQELSAAVEWWNRRDNIEHGRGDLKIGTHGLAYFGPVHPDKGQLEFERLRKLYTSIAKNGYDRTQGDIRVTVLKRGSERAYLVGGGGYHRLAAMAALGYETVTATFHRTSLVDIDHVHYWPQVRSGLWTAEQATQYVDHLFEFDSRRWAKQQGLPPV